jgi:uncharacterized protein YegP (UPF0339 family)
MANEAPGTFIIHLWAGKFSWELRSPTGQAMAEGKGFPSMETTKNAVQWVKDNAAKCPVATQDHRPKGHS